MNWDSKSTSERRPSLVGLLGLSCLYTRLYHALAALVSPVQNIFFLTVHYFNLYAHIAKQLGQSVVQGHLSLNVCLRMKTVALRGCEGAYCTAYGVEALLNFFTKIFVDVCQR